VGADAEGLEDSTPATPGLSELQQLIRPASHPTSLNRHLFRRHASRFGAGAISNLSCPIQSEPRIQVGRRNPVCFGAQTAEIVDDATMSSRKHRYPSDFNSDRSNQWHPCLNIVKCASKSAAVRKVPAQDWTSYHWLAREMLQMRPVRQRIIRQRPVSLSSRYTQPALEKVQRHYERPVEDGPLIAA